MGQLMSIPTEAILAEANLPSIKTRSTQLTTIAMEKSLLREEVNPRHQLATKIVRQRTKKESWRKRVKEKWKKIFGYNNPQTQPALLPPWLELGDHEIECKFDTKAEAVANIDAVIQRLDNNWESLT